MTRMMHPRWARALAAAGLVALGAAIGSLAATGRLVGTSQAQDSGARVLAPVAVESIPDVVERISPAVVTVGAIKRAIVIDPFFDFFAPFGPPMGRARELQQRTPYIGSGFLIDKQGHILTNFHVIEDSIEVFVTFGDGREAPARVLDFDRFIDVALLRVEMDESELPEPLEMGDSDRLRIGETAVALGSPYGTVLSDPRPTVTRGVVSALHRSFRPDRRKLRVYQDMIQTDAAINPGNSGGPLVDGQGRAIGINTFIVSGTGGSVGLGFAIPINRARAFVDEVRTYGKLRPLRIDFGALTVRTPRVQGVLVTQVEDVGPATTAGLLDGDVIIAVDNRRVETREDLILQLASRQVGDTLTFRVWRNGEEFDTRYELSEDLRVTPAPPGP